MKLELYYYIQCPFCLRVVRKIEELGLKDYIEHKDTLVHREHNDFHYHKTGRTTVPCLYIDGRPMFESSDINIWLEKNEKRIKE